jgi:hypothetical protein
VVKENGAKISNEDPFWIRKNRRRYGGRTDESGEPWTTTAPHLQLSSTVVIDHHIALSPSFSSRIAFEKPFPQVLYKDFS